LNPPNKNFYNAASLIYAYDDVLGKYPERKDIALNILQQTFCEIGNEKISTAFDAFVLGKNKFKQSVTFRVEDICPRYISSK
jgi:hypothetical protein